LKGRKKRTWGKKKHKVVQRYGGTIKGWRRRERGIFAFLRRGKKKCQASILEAEREKKSAKIKKKRKEVPAQREKNRYTKGEKRKKREFLIILRNKGKGPGCK